LQRSLFGVFAYSSRALALVWTTNKALSIALAVLTSDCRRAAGGGRLCRRPNRRRRHPCRRLASAYRHDRTDRRGEVRRLEALLVAATSMAQRGMSLAQSLLRAQLGQRVNVMILEKALTLDLTQFEDSEFYDKLTRARREASSRPLSLVMRTFGLLQNAISLISFGGLLVRFSPWAVVLLILAGLPAFLAEAKFSGEAFRLFRWRAPGIAHAIYLESVLAREDTPKRSSCSSWDRAAGSLSRDIHAPVPRRPRPDFAPRRLGLRLGCSARPRCTAATRGLPRKPCSAP
jgi:ATP-binding cassette subfamily B protein